MRKRLVTIKQGWNRFQIPHIDLNTSSRNMSDRSLCSWCRKNVFDEHTLAIIYPGDQTKSSSRRLESNSPFREGVDLLAYYANRNFVTGYNRCIQPNLDIIEQNKLAGCIFCRLLKSILDQYLTSSEVEESSKFGPKVSFILTLKHPWQWSTITLIVNSDDKSLDFEAYFRLYPLNDHMGLPSEIPTRATIELQRDLRSLSHTGRWANYVDSWAPILEKDGKALRAMIGDCAITHSGCKLDEVMHLPSMLLQLSGNIVSPSVRLLLVSNIKVHPIHYVCLSYCWGGPQPMMTTAGNVESYLSGIETTNLPKTIVDAMRVTISMGYEYLWVDALCIVQDGGHLKNAELSKMSSIYAGAVCTICVMSVSKATDGFLPSTSNSNSTATETWHTAIDESKKHKAAVLEIRSDFSKHELMDSPLRSRAWTYQEALLSRRLIMFFSHGERPVMRCTTSNVRTDGGRILQIPKSLICLQGIMANFENPKDIHASFNASEEWVTIVKEYTRRSLTFQTDAMPVLIGIVSEWEKTIRPGKYCAGLWHGTLDRDLLWRVPRKLSPRAAHELYIAPSWSWASRAHPVEYQSLSELTTCPEFRIIDCDITPVHQDLPYGAIKFAKLTIECPAELGEFKDPESEDSNTSVSVGDKVGEFVFDDQPRPPGICQVLLLHLNDEEPYNTSYLIGYGVVEVEDADGKGKGLFRRVGMFSYFPDSTWPKRQFILV